MKYVTAKEIKDMYHISGTTLKRWREDGNIRFKKISDKKILYLIKEECDPLHFDKMQTVGFSSIEQTQDYINNVKEQYLTINPDGIKRFYDDTYENVDDPFNKTNGEYDLIGKILNNEICAIVLTQDIIKYNNYTKLIYILKTAVMKKIHIYIYNDNDKSFKIYTNMDMNNDLINYPKTEYNEGNKINKSHLYTIKNGLGGSYYVHSEQIIKLNKISWANWEKNNNVSDPLNKVLSEVNYIMSQNENIVTYPLSCMLSDLKYILNLTNDDTNALNEYFDMILKRGKSANKIMLEK
ncbi:MAG: hypothetical protein [Wendovervirus sonii]|uniref:Helix-turn-helix domain-containing protein n=1 Tax=phage Lak_Megaphage_Sonny TaxID=3109229 RepID=A0ABZ0Z3L1_9CAUD|nr:MAG: hypothetical protein [phage Lak_Megaphage_Sonny]